MARHFDPDILECHRKIQFLAHSGHHYMSIHLVCIYFSSHTDSIPHRSHRDSLSFYHKHGLLEYIYLMSIDDRHTLEHPLRNYNRANLEEKIIYHRVKLFYIPMNHSDANDNHWHHK